MSMDRDVIDDPFDSYMEQERESETQNEAEVLGEYERDREELWYAIYQSVRAAKRYMLSDREIQRAVNEALHE